MPITYQGAGGPISGENVRNAHEALGCESETLWALLTVETAGFGYQIDRRPKILFERHVFHKLTRGEFDGEPDISARESGGYLGGAGEYVRLHRAMERDREAALQSASWGLGQIMGFHAEKLNYASVDQMIDRFVGSEGGQLEGVCRFINAAPALKNALRARDWSKVAFFYNGSAYAKNRYDEKLRYAYERFRQQQQAPDVEVRAAQAYLTYMGYKPHGIDGFKGKNTLDALHAFQHDENLAVDDHLDADTVELLRQAFRRRNP